MAIQCTIQIGDFCCSQRHWNRALIQGFSLNEKRRLDRAYIIVQRIIRLLGIQQWIGFRSESKWHIFRDANNEKEELPNHGWGTPLSLVSWNHGSQWTVVASLLCVPSSKAKKIPLPNPYLIAFGVNYFGRGGCTEEADIIDIISSLRTFYTIYIYIFLSIWYNYNNCSDVT